MVNVLNIGLKKKNDISKIGSFVIPRRKRKLSRGRKDLVKKSLFVSPYLNFASVSRPLPKKKITGKRFSLVKKSLVVKMKHQKKLKNILRRITQELVT